MPTFDEQSIYIKHQEGCNCEDESNCSCDSSDCGCCPPGLVAVYNSKNEHSGCLTPNDASCYEVAKSIPIEGYMKLYDPVTNVFLGELTVAEALAYLSAVNPAIILPGTAGDFNIVTQDSVAIAVAGAGLTSSGAVGYEVDRISCDDSVTVTLVTPPAGVTFLGGLTSINIPSGSSDITDGILIDDTIAVGAHNITVQYDGCSTSKTQTITLNVA